MKITPAYQGTMTVGAIGAGEPQQSMVDKVRSLRMKTQATPGVADEVIEPQAPAELPINPPNEDQTRPEETKPLSPQLAALAKQRRALQIERQALDKQKADLEALRKDFIDPAQLKSDPLGTVLGLGVTYDQLAEAVMADKSGQTPKIRELEAKLEAVESGVEKRLAQEKAQNEQQALLRMRKEAEVLSSSGDEFEMVRETKSLPAVMKLIERTYREHGEVLEVREALKLVEDELVKEGLQLANIKKVQGQIQPQQPPAPQLQPQRQIRTLTNRDTASAPLSKKARALAAFYGTLKT